MKNEKQISMSTWAIVNTALLFGPIALGFGYFFMWYVPNPIVQIPSAIVLVTYYVVVIYIGQYTSGEKPSWKHEKTYIENLKKYVFTALGFIMFSLLAYAGIYVTCGALITMAIGANVSKEFEVDAFYRAHRKTCGYELILKDMPHKFCFSAIFTSEKFYKGEIVTLYGKESALGFRVMEITGANKSLKDAP